MSIFSRRPLYYAYRQILKKYFINLLRKETQKKRNKNFVINEYKARWNINSDINETLNDKLSFARLNDELVLVRGIDHIKYQVQKISQEISSIQPKTIIELGSGYGINLLSLAVLHPEVKIWQGVELTEEGVQAAETIKNALPQKNIQEISYITGYPVNVVIKRLKTAKIKFYQGDIINLSSDQKFDLVFTCKVIEQIPKDYMSAFKEAKKVSDGYGLFIEPFREVQSNLFEHLHLHNMDYFHGSYKKVEETGFKILKLEPLELKKLEFTYGLLLCKI